MDKVTKTECLNIINDIKNNEVPFWDWDEDYYGTGLTDKIENIEWTNKRLDKIKEFIMKADFE